MKLQPREMVLILVLTLVALASTADLVMDFSEGVQARHLVQEALILFAAVMAIGWILMGLRRQRREIASLQEQLASSNQAQPRDPRLLEARSRMSAMIAQQFEDWDLSSSEKEIGQLLLKGLSLREIAAVRGTEEKTVRQQASAIYRKANLSGRHAFAAWFIEDFL